MFKKSIGIRVDRFLYEDTEIVTNITLPYPYYVGKDFIFYVLWTIFPPLIFTIFCEELVIYCIIHKLCVLCCVDLISATSLCTASGSGEKTISITIFAAGFRQRTKLLCQGPLYQLRQELIQRNGVPWNLLKMFFLRTPITEDDSWLAPLRPFSAGHYITLFLFFPQFLSPTCLLLTSQVTGWKNRWFLTSEVTRFSFGSMPVRSNGNLANNCY